MLDCAFKRVGGGGGHVGGERAAAVALLIPIFVAEEYSKNREALLRVCLEIPTVV